MERERGRERGREGGREREREMRVVPSGGSVRLYLFLSPQYYLYPAHTRFFLSLPLSHTYTLTNTHSLTDREARTLCV